MPPTSINPPIKLVTSILILLIKKKRPPTENTGSQKLPDQQVVYPQSSFPLNLILTHKSTRVHGGPHVSLCHSLTSAFITLPPLPPSASFTLFIGYFFFLLFQGLFGGGALGVPSRRRGERERHHFWSQGGDACPGAAVGEGADGHPRPRLGAR